jgi:hypothetical protein
MSESHIIQENGIVCRLEELDEEMWVINRHSSGSSSKTNFLVKDLFETLIVAMISQGFPVAYGFEYSVPYLQSSPLDPAVNF